MRVSVNRQLGYSGMLSVNGQLGCFGGIFYQGDGYEVEGGYLL